jgi:SAM-dependent methyltransferase
MNVLEKIHGGYVHNRRVRVLAQKLSALLPDQGRILDVGCGDGLLSALVQRGKPNASVTGIDVRVRSETHIPVEQFDGRTIPFADGTFEALMLVDVLHHTDAPAALLREAARVARDSIVIKDHTTEGVAAEATLRFMDRIGNRRHNVALLHNYWPRQRWLDAFAELNLKVDAWIDHLRLYPLPLDWFFGRSLHFISLLRPLEARLSGSSHASVRSSDTSEFVRISDSQECCSSPWEKAYLRFETPEEEIEKFMRRLRQAGCEEWPKDAKIIELFCGRGNGLHALAKLGFSKVEGADLSASLIAQYSGPAKCYVCDCRELPFKSASRDIIVIQGGLHHLPQLPADLERTLAEIERVLRPGGRFFLVEPWLTPFLRMVHFACKTLPLRKLFTKLDSLATMIDHERRTYEQWLSRPEAIVALLSRHFPEGATQIAWGKIRFLGHRATQNGSHLHV